MLRVGFPRIAEGHSLSNMRPATFAPEAGSNKLKPVPTSYATTKAYLLTTSSTAGARMSRAAASARGGISMPLTRCRRVFARPALLRYMSSPTSGPLVPGPATKNTKRLASSITSTGCPVWRDGPCGCSRSLEPPSRGRRRTFMCTLQSYALSSKTRTSTSIKERESLQ